VERCVRCGGMAEKKYVLVKGLDLAEVYLCNQCYENYIPIRFDKRGNIVFKPYKRVYFSMYSLIIESRSLAKVVERIGRGLVGRVASTLSFIGIPASILVFLLMLYSAVNRFLKPLDPELTTILSKLPKGYALILIPGIDPMLPLIQGWIALIISITLHEFFHGLVAINHGRSLASVGLMIPFGAFAKVIDARPGDLRIYSAGITVNLLISITAFSILAMVKPLPEIFLKNPLTLLAPIDILRLKGIDISLTFSESILYYIGLVNIWLFIINSIPFLITDGTYILTGILTRFTKLKRAIIISQLFSAIFITAIVYSAILHLIA